MPRTPGRLRGDTKLRGPCQPVWNRCARCLREEAWKCSIGLSTCGILFSAATSTKGQTTVMLAGQIRKDSLGLAA